MVILRPMRLAKIHAIRILIAEGIVGVLPTRGEIARAT